MLMVNLPPVNFPSCTFSVPLEILMVPLCLPVTLLPNQAMLLAAVSTARPAPATGWVVDTLSFCSSFFPSGLYHSWSEIQIHLTVQREVFSCFLFIWLVDKCHQSPLQKGERRRPKVWPNNKTNAKTVFVVETLSIYFFRCDTSNKTLSYWLIITYLIKHLLNIDQKTFYWKLQKWVHSTKTKRLLYLSRIISPLFCIPFFQRSILYHDHLSYPLILPSPLLPSAHLFINSTEIPAVHCRYKLRGVSVTPTMYSQLQVNTYWKYSGPCTERRKNCRERLLYWNIYCFTRYTCGGSCRMTRKERSFNPSRLLKVSGMASFTSSPRAGPSSRTEWWAGHSIRTIPGKTSISKQPICNYLITGKHLYDRNDAMGAASGYSSGICGIWISGRLYRARGFIHRDRSKSR